MIYKSILKAQIQFVKFGRKLTKDLKYKYNIFLIELPYNNTFLYVTYERVFSLVFTLDDRL